MNTSNALYAHSFVYNGISQTLRRGLIIHISSFFSVASVRDPYNFNRHNALVV